MISQPNAALPGRIFLAGLLVTMLVLALLTPVATTPARAQSGEAECSNLDDPSDDGWTNHAQLGQRLEQIEATSQGRVTVDVIGHTYEGRELYAARVGTGDRVLVVTSEIHGNEKTGTEALLQMLKHLGSSGSPTAQAVRAGVTLVAVPMINPDGAERNRRQNFVPWSDIMARHGLANSPRAWYYSSGAQGFDLNRDFHPDLDFTVSQGDLPGNSAQPGFYLNHEAQALRDLYQDLQAEFGEVEAYVDLHHMGSCNREGGSMPNIVYVDAPSSAMGQYRAAGASFGPEPTRRGFPGEIVLVGDGTANPTEGCSPLLGFPEGAIALIDRGSCPFVQKVNNAQDAGAIAVVVVNNQAGDPINMGGSDPGITIPAVHIARDDGDVIKAGLPATGRAARVLGQYVSVALDYPPLGPDGNPKYAGWPLLDQEKSRRYALAAALGLHEKAGGGNGEPSPYYGGVNRYFHPTSRDIPGQARSSFALNGTATVLFEVRGQQHAWGQKQMGMLTQVVLHGLWGIAEHMADGSVDDLDGNDFYSLPRYW